MFLTPCRIHTRRNWGVLEAKGVPTWYLIVVEIRSLIFSSGLLYHFTHLCHVSDELFCLLSCSNVGDSKVMKSVDRILSIWEERSVYKEELIAELRASLVKEESPAALETPKGE